CSPHILEHKSTRRPHTTSLLQTENATEFNASAKPPNATRAGVSPEEKTSSGLSETQEATQETPSTSDFTGLYDAQANKTAMDSNKTNTNKDLQTAQPSMETTDQRSPMTHAHTSAITTVTDFNGTVSTSGVKTTERKEVTDKWTSTQGPELETSSMTKPKKTLTTTKKTTTKRSPPPSKDNQQANPGPVVAAVIGTTFVLMLIAIIFILVRKRKMQRRQLENPEWAGPSPFLDGDVQPNLPNMDESETINRQGFNQMSTSRYLSQRLSKHLTFGRNTSEDVLMGDILQGSTFGSAQEPVMENKESKQTDDLTPSLSSGPDTVIKPPPPLVSIDLDSLSEEAAPLQTSDGGIVPPAPPLLKQLQHTFLEVPSESEDLDQLLQVCLIRVGAKFCRTVALQEQVWTPHFLVNFHRRQSLYNFKIAYLLEVSLSTPAYSCFEANN
uniref:Uncharacterized protein n=1 Tax=Sinocyclocheilus rhinocerous TaxID=307959 RepID=A0A673IT64_9TELE